MTTYTVLLSRHSSNDRIGFHISVFPSGFGGAVPYRNYESYEEFISALLRLGVLAENISSLVRQLELEKSATLLNWSLSEVDAAYFGWPN